MQRPGLDPLIPGVTRADRDARRAAAANDLLVSRSGVGAAATRAEIARRYGVGRTTVSTWNAMLSLDNARELHIKRMAGRPSKLNPCQFSEIKAIYREGAKASKVSCERWTAARLGEAIERRFGIRYHRDSISRLIRKLGLREQQSEAGGP